MHSLCTLLFTILKILYEWLLLLLYQINKGIMGGSLYIFRRDAFFQLFRFVCVYACTRVWCFVPMCDVYKRVSVSTCVPEQVLHFPPLLSVSVTWDKVSYWTKYWLFWLGWLVSELETSSLCILSLGVIDMCSHAWLFRWLLSMWTCVLAHFHRLLIRSCLTLQVDTEDTLYMPFLFVTCADYPLILPHCKLLKAWDFVKHLYNVSCFFCDAEESRNSFSHRRSALPDGMLGYVIYRYICI